MSASVGERHAAEALFATHHVALERYLARLTGDRDLAADIAQETFLRLMERPPPNGAARAWLFRVATNLVRDDARRAERHRRLGLSRGPELAQADPPPPPDGAADRRRARGLVRRALDALSPKERTALLMREEGFKHREIAEALDTTTGSVGTLLARAIQKAATCLEEAGEIR